MQALTRRGLGKDARTAAVEVAFEDLLFVADIGALAFRFTSEQVIEVGAYD